MRLTSNKLKGLSLALAVVRHIRWGSWEVLSGELKRLSESIADLVVGRWEVVVPQQRRRARLAASVKLASQTTASSLPDDTTSSRSHCTLQKNPAMQPSTSLRMFQPTKRMMRPIPVSEPTETNNLARVEDVLTDLLHRRRSTVVRCSTRGPLQTLGKL